MTLPPLKLFLLFSLFSISFSHETPSSHDHHHVFPRPLILEYSELEEEVRLRCSSWRFAGEANNLSPWKTVPKECAEYVKEYMTGKGYVYDLEIVSKEAEEYAKSVQLNEDGLDAWIFDIDETLLSNLPYYAAHGFGLQVFDHAKFDDWVVKGVAPAIEPSLKLYEDVLNLGYKVILLTGRSEQHRAVTVDNLINAGFRDWHQLILRGSDDKGKRAVIYKSEKRSEMEKDGYRILGNSGDQWSDLIGSSLSVKSFKLPNPMGSSRDPRGIPVSDCKLVSRSLKEFGAFIVKDIRWSLPDYDIFHEDIETFFKSLSNTPHLQKQFGVPEEVPMTSVYFWKFARRPENNAPVKDYGVSNVTPCGFPDWNPTMDNWSFNMLGIACMVAEMAAIGFGLPVDAFTSRIHYGLHTLATIGSNLGKDVQEGTILQACHHNFNFLTIHGRNKFHGLHIWLRNAARVEVKIPVGCFVIQAGKQLEWLTGGACLATNHDIVVTKTTMDVINKMKERDCSLWRVSSSLYVHALSDAILKPLEPFDKHTVKMANDYPPVPAEYVVREYAEMRHAMQKKILEGDGSSVS